VSEPRVRRAKGEERVEEVLRAAEELLTRRGAEGVSLRDVADQVGISVGNLQYYFPTRADLLDAVFERQREIFTEEFEALSARTEDPREKLEVLVDYWLGVQHTEGQSFFWYLWAASPHDERARAIMDRIYGTLPPEMAGWMRQIHPKLTPSEALRRAAVIGSLIEGSGLFVGYGRTPQRALKSLQSDVRTIVMEIIDRPPTRR
jgi:AcrR family transcriptional regulator